MDKYEYKQLSERMIELMQNEEYGEAKSFFSKVLTLDAKDEVALKALESIKLWSGKSVSIVGMFLY